MKLTRSTKNAISERMCFLSEVMAKGTAFRRAGTQGEGPASFGRPKGF